MPRDFAIKPEDVAATRAREAARTALEEREADPGNPELFNFAAGRPLPEGFENPPCGDYGHRCVDRDGRYQPDWTQLFIEKIVDHQNDPQPLSCLPKYLVPLETWVDVPPSVMKSLESAVQTHHEHVAKPGDIILGVKTEHKEIKRSRFHWKEIRSA